MYCSECGAKVVDGSKFCSSCGKRLTGVSTSSEGMAGGTVAVVSKPKTEGRRPLWRKVLGDRERSALRCVLGIVVWVVILLVGMALSHGSTGFDYIDMRTSEYVAKYGRSGLSGAQWLIFWIGILLNVAGIAMVYCWLQALLSRIRPANRSQSIWAKVLAVAICFLFYCGFSMLRWYGNDCKPCWSMWDTFILVAVCTAVWRGLVGKADESEKPYVKREGDLRVDEKGGIDDETSRKYSSQSIRKVFANEDGIAIVLTLLAFSVIICVVSCGAFSESADNEGDKSTRQISKSFYIGGGSQNSGRKIGFAGIEFNAKVDVNDGTWKSILEGHYSKQIDLATNMEIEGVAGWNHLEIHVRNETVECVVLDKGDYENLESAKGIFTATFCELEEKWGVRFRQEKVEDYEVAVVRASLHKGRLDAWLRLQECVPDGTWNVTLFVRPAKVK